MLESLGNEFLMRLAGGPSAEVRLLERSTSSLRVGIYSHKLPEWRESGRISRLASAVTRVTDSEYELAVVGTRLAGALVPDPGFGFDSFICSPLNEQALEAAQDLASEDRGPLSPLLLHGPSASGKTHLLRAIAHTIRQRRPDARILCIDSETLCQQMISALRRGVLSSFRSKLCSLDALLLDDVESLARRDATQEAISEALEALQPGAAIIALTASRAPGQIGGLVEPLRSRIATCRTVSLSEPEWEARVAIVLERAISWNVEISPEVASLLVATLDPLLQQLDTTLTRLLQNNRAFPRGLLKVDAVQRALSHPRAPLPPSSGTRIISLVSRHFGLRLADLRSASRSRRVAIPRQIAMYLLRRHCGLSFPEIGQRFRRHHTTAMHACRHIERERDQNSGLRSTLALLEKDLQQMSS